jgi:hypothetical protein
MFCVRGVLGYHGPIKVWIEGCLQVRRVEPGHPSGCESGESDDQQERDSQTDQLRPRQVLCRPTPQYTSGVQTLCYRAPELLFHPVPSVMVIDVGNGGRHRRDSQ